MLANAQTTITTAIHTRIQMQLAQVNCVPAASEPHSMAFLMPKVFKLTPKKVDQ